MADNNAAERFEQHLDIIQRFVCKAIVDEKGAGIIEELRPKIDQWIKDAYGPVEKKIFVQVNGGDKTEIQEEIPEIFDTVLNFVANNKAVYMVGPAGCGKSVLSEMIAKALGKQFYESDAITNSAQFDGFTDAMGRYHQTPFYHAYKNGGVFMLDEVDASIPEVLTRLNAALANGYHVFPEGLGSDMKTEEGGFIRKHKDFRVIAAGNTYGTGADYRYVGRNQLDMATLDRFVVIPVYYEPKIDRKLAEDDEELLFFCDEYRKLIDKFALNAIFSYRSLSAIKTAEKFEKDTGKVLKWCLLKSMPADDVRTLAYELDKFKDLNRYVKALCRIGKEQKKES